jgi:flagellar hook-length control protein FliK
MNIDGTKLISVLQSTAPAEGAAVSSLIDNGAPTGGFAEALTGQIESLSETKLLSKLSDQLSNSVLEQPDILPARMGLADNPSDEQKLGRLSGNTPPLLTVHEDIDAETNTALAELADMFGYSSAGIVENLPSVEIHTRKEIVEGGNNQKGDLSLVLSRTQTLPSMPLRSGQSQAVHLPAPEAGETSFSDHSSPMVPGTDFVDSGEGREPPLSSAFSNATKADGQKTTENKREVSAPMHPVAEVVLPVNDHVSEQVMPMTEAVPSFMPYSGQEQATPAQEPAKIEGENLSDTPSRREASPDVIEPGIKGGRLVAAVEAKATKSDGLEPEMKNEVSEQVAPMAEAVPSFAVYSGQPQVVNNPAQLDQEQTASRSMQLDQEKIVNNSSNQTENQKAPFSFVKPFPNEFQSNPSESAPALEDTLQKGSAFGQLVKEAQHPPLNSLEKVAQSVSQSPVEAQATASSVDRSFSQGMPEIAQLNRQPIDNKPEVPAMMRSLGHSEWNKDLGERIIWMTNKELSSAEIKLNPEHLGPISVRIEMNNDQATIAFTAQHAAVREALEASLPKLREMMSQQQLNLVDINVSQNTSSDQNQSQSRHSPRHFNGFVHTSGDASDLGDEIENGRTVVGKGLLSLYA